MIFLEEYEGGTIVNKHQLVLNELRALSYDLNKLIEEETAHWEEMYKKAEERRMATIEGKLGPLAMPHDPNHLREELEYFLSRLRSVEEYLFSDVTDIAATTKFLKELTRKLTS
jgi:polyhydroxyalkanoate synthesis regulator phasin